ncbi:MAG: efflux RND transporter periplasmic adaptor subunit [Rhodospirillales bacterium]
MHDPVTGPRFPARPRAGVAGRLAAVIVAALALALPAAPAPAQQPPAVVGVDAVVQEPLTQTVAVIGRLVANQESVVAARIKGPVGSIRVKVGDRLKAGDVIATLVSDRLVWERASKAAQVTESQARLAESRSALKLAVQELKRLENLRKSAAFSKARRDDKRQGVARARSMVNVFKANVNQARAALKLADIDVANATIRAPFPGVVTVRHTDVGAYVNVGDPVVTLVNDRALEVEANVPAARIAGLAPGTAVEVRVAGGGRYRARVRAVVPEENPLTRTRVVRFTPEIDDPGALAANQSVTVNLPVGRSRQVVTVHKDAVLNRNGMTFVFVFVDGTVQIRPVRLGEAVGGRFEVLNGVKTGDLVVVRGNERLLPGQKVRIKRTS